MFATYVFNAANHQIVKQCYTNGIKNNFSLDYETLHSTAL